MNDKEVITIREFDSQPIEQIESSSTETDAVLDYDLIYEKCYDAFSDALNDYFSSHPITFNTSYVASPDEPLEYASGSDARLFTVEVADAPTSSAQATEAYILDIRNIIVFACIIWLVVIFYSKLKNLVINYTTKD